MKLLPSVFSTLYSGINTFVFAVNSKRHFSIFVWFISRLREKNRKSEVIFAVCRLPRAVNVMLKLSIVIWFSLFFSRAARALTAVRPCWFREFRVLCAQDKSTGRRLYHYIAYKLRNDSLFVYFQLSGRVKYLSLSLRKCPERAHNFYCLKIG